MTDDNDFEFCDYLSYASIPCIFGIIGATVFGGIGTFLGYGLASIERIGRNDFSSNSGHPVDTGTKVLTIL